MLREKYSNWKFNISMDAWTQSFSLRQLSRVENVIGSSSRRKWGKKICCPNALWRLNFIRRLFPASCQRPPSHPSFSLRRALFLSARDAFLVKISEFLRRGFCNRERREPPSPPTPPPSSPSLSLSCFQCAQYTGFKTHPIYATMKERRIIENQHKKNLVCKVHHKLPCDRKKRDHNSLPFSFSTRLI